MRGRAPSSGGQGEARGGRVAPKKVLPWGVMINIKEDIQSRQLKKSKRPVVVTIKGKAAVVVQDAAACQRLLDIVALADAREGIRQGLEESKNAKGRPAREFFAEFEAQKGIKLGGSGVRSPVRPNLSVG